MIRFWDTSALVKRYDARESHHLRVLSLLEGSEGRKAKHVTSMLVAVELVAVLARTTKNKQLVASARGQLDAFVQLELNEKSRDLALRIAEGGKSRGADATIVAQMLLVAEAAEAPIQFVTADVEQSRLVSKAQRKNVQLLLLAD